jgi:hypothetical protein
VAALPGEEGIYEAGAGVLHVRTHATLHAPPWLVISHINTSCVHTGR